MQLSWSKQSLLVLHDALLNPAHELLAAFRAFELLISAETVARGTLQVSAPAACLHDGGAHALDAGTYSCACAQVKLYVMRGHNGAVQCDGHTISISFDPCQGLAIALAR
jgi:hypothetical protein